MPSVEQQKSELKQSIRKEESEIQKLQEELELKKATKESLKAEMKIKKVKQNINEDLEIELQIIRQKLANKEKDFLEMVEEMGRQKQQVEKTQLLILEKEKNEKELQYQLMLINTKIPKLIKENENLLNLVESKDRENETLFQENHQLNRKITKMKNNFES